MLLGLKFIYPNRGNSVLCKTEAILSPSGQIKTSGEAYILLLFEIPGQLLHKEILKEGCKMILNIYILKIIILIPENASKQ